MYKIKEELANAIINYLASKPYAETFQLIQSIQSLEKIEGKDEKEKK